MSMTRACIKLTWMGWDGMWNDDDARKVTEEGLSSQVYVLRKFNLKKCLKFRSECCRRYFS
jgi:hypothetical protein